MKRISLYIFLLLFAVNYAQEKDFILPKANEKFNKKQFIEAEEEYRVSKNNNGKRATAAYNLGNAIYKQNQPSEAKFAYEKAIASAKGKQQKFSAYHNLGNTLMKGKEYAKAEEAYKNALRNNPNDEKTRYNFALAKKMNKENPEKKDDKKDKNKDKKDDKKEQPKDEDDKKNEPQKPKEDKPKPQPNKADQERMKNLLEAVNNEEKKTQDKVNAKKVKGKPTENDKDW